MKKIALLFASALITFAAGAQVSITSSSLIYSQNFNTLDTGGSGLTNLPAGWSIYEWGGSGGINSNYRASNGSANNGDTYSFGAIQNTDRALGSIGSGAIPNINYGVKFVNNTGTTIAGFGISFKEEQWRRGGAGNNDTVRFYYNTASGNTIADSTFGSWTQVPSLMMNSIATTPTVGALNGNDTSRVLTAYVPVTIPAGGSISLRWYDFNSIGSDDGLSIDSLVVAFALNASSSNSPLIIGVSPAPNSTVAPSTSNIAVILSKPVTLGTGNFYIRNRTTQTTQTIAVSSSSVTITGTTATVSGVTLQPGMNYHVTFDSTVVDSAGFRSTGLYDSSFWRFTTQGVGVHNIAQSAIPVTVVNPAHSGTFHILYTLPQSAMITATVYDLSGREVARKTFTSTKGDNRVQLNTTLSAGTYIIRLDDGKQWGSAKATIE